MIYDVTKGIGCLMISIRRSLLCYSFLFHLVCGLEQPDIKMFHTAFEPS